MPDAGFDTAIPVREHRAVQEAGGRVTVLVPKFSSTWARRYLAPLFAVPDIRVHLDDLGSSVWNACDGRTTVAELTRTVHEREGGDHEHARERVHAFLRKLAREGSISFIVKEHD